MFLRIGKKRRKSSNDVYETNMTQVNMTPLIDVSLVLVLILLLATPLGLESSIAVKKAAYRAKDVEERRIDERIELFVLSEDTVRVDRRIIARKDLSRTLGPLIQSSGHPLIVMDCGGNVSHGAFVDVLDQAKICGASEIAVMGR